MRETSRQQNTFTGTPGGVLAGLISKIRHAIGLTNDKLGVLTERYCIRLARGKERDTWKSDKGNFLKAFNSNEISILNFFRFLSAIEIKSIRFHLTLKMKDDSIVEVEETFEFPSAKKESGNNETKQSSE